jgi:hypothetical protein
MDWLKNLFKSPSAERDYWFYVQCDHCKEIIKARVDLYSHLSIQYPGGNQPNTYYCRKVIIGGKRCYKQIEVELTFDLSRKLTDSQIKGGKFVTKEQYLATLTQG